MRKLLLSILCALVPVAVHAGPIVVAIIDTGIANIPQKLNLCASGHRDFTTDNSILDKAPEPHGTNVASLIATSAGPGNYCLLVLKIFRYENGVELLDMNAYIAALDYVITLRPAILNLSLSGRNPLVPEAVRIKAILANGTTVVAAAGNDYTKLSTNNCNVYPACIDPRIYVIGNGTSKTSNYGPVVDYIVDGSHKTAGGSTMTGTSQATAIFTGRAIRKALELQK